MYYPHTYCHIELLVVCNLFYATMGSNNCMCCIELKISCIQRLQNDNFFYCKVQTIIDWAILASIQNV
jgi:hypothetical protein